VLLVGLALAELIETSRRSWFVVSATECAASARSADEPLSVPATPFTVAMVAFAATATSTVFLLAEATAALLPSKPPFKAPTWRRRPSGRPGSARASV